MTQWTDLLEEHPLFTSLENLGPAIDDALGSEGLESDEAESLSRLKAVLAFTGCRLAGADPFVIQSAVLDKLDAQFQTIISETQQFTGNGNSGHLTNANTNADNVLTFLAQLNVPLTTEDFQAVKESAEAYRKGLDHVLSEVRGSFEDFSSDLESLKAKTIDFGSQIDSEKSRLSTVATEAQTKFSDGQETRTTTFAASQKEQQDKNNVLLADYKQKLADQNAEFSKQREEIAREHQDKLDSLREVFEVEATKLRDEINGRKEEVEKLVGVIGNLGVTSGYLTTANGARTTVWIWQGVTVAAMIGLITVAIYAFLPAISGEFSWGSFAGRVFISLTFGVLAAYAASQADKYQKVERRNRQLALELEAMGPYIAPLPLEKQEEFRLSIGERSFGHGDGLLSGSDAKSPATMMDILLHSKEFKTFVAEIVKASRA